MTNRQYHWQHNALSYCWLGVLVVLTIVGLIFLSYILLIGAAIGLVLFLFSWLKQRFFSPKRSSTTTDKQSHGRVIEHDEIKDD